MRTCMYCGRELEKGEVCSCPQSVMRRNAKEYEKREDVKREEPKGDGKAGNQGNENPYRTETSYKTGYAGEDNRFERARNKYRAKREAKKNSPRRDGGFWREVWRYITAAVKSPVESVINPRHLGKGAMLSVAAIMGAVMWLCVFFIARGGAVGPLKLIASAMSFGGMEGYKLLASIGACILSGAVGGIVIFFLYTGIFYLIHRFIMRMKTDYWYFCVRLVSAWIPFTLICLIGTLLSLLSPIALAALVLCGAVVAAVLTYEALRTEWAAFSPSKVLYGMFLGYFVIFTIAGHLVAMG